MNDLGYDLFRPRDEFDVDVHPESVRGKALALMDETARIRQVMRDAIAVLPWYRRLPIRAFLRLRGVRL